MFGWFTLTQMSNKKQTYLIVLLEPESRFPSYMLYMTRLSLPLFTIVSSLSLSLFCGSLRNGVTVPMGPGMKTGVGAGGGYSLLYNEFIVYNPAQTHMRYLLRVQFNYSSLWWDRDIL